VVLDRHGKELPDDQHSCERSAGLQLVSMVGYSAQSQKDLGVVEKVYTKLK